MNSTYDRRTILKTAALASTALVIPGCGETGSPATQTSGATSADGDALLDQIADGLLAEYPESASWLGLAKDERAPLNALLTDQSPAGVAARAEGTADRLASLTDALSKLDGTARLDADVAIEAHAIAVEGYAFGYGDTVNLNPYFGYRNGPYVVTQNMGSYIDVSDVMTNVHVIDNETDREDYAARIAAFAASLAGETQRLKQDHAKGVVAPDFILTKTLAALQSTLAQDTTQMPIYRAIAGEGASPSAQAERVAALIDNAVKPALADQITELQVHAAGAHSNAGVWDLPDGDEYYRWSLKAGTTTTLSPEEIHQIGQEKLKEIQARMDEVLTANGMSGGTVGERMTALAQNPDQLFANTTAGREELLTYVRSLVDDMRGRMPQAFNTLVPGFLEVKRIAPEVEAGAPGGMAGPGSIDGQEPGTYFINLRDTALHPKFGLPTLSYHEAIPGHVWQGEYTFKQRLIRTLLAFNAYSEGWALYAEQLSDELGAYDDNPLGILGYLQANAFRCCRLVVDTGMHAMRWTREETIDWFVTNNGSSRDEVQSEIDRYCVWPGQACGYKIGEIAINRARDRAQAQLGDKYDLKAFNDAVVLGGAVPMTTLDGVIDDYIAKAI